MIKLNEDSDVWFAIKSVAAVVLVIISMCAVVVFTATLLALCEKLLAAIFSVIGVSP